MAAFDTLTAKMTPLDLQPGYSIILEAINTSTGSAVTGVTVSGVSIFGLDLTAAAAGGTAEELGPFMLVPGPGA